MYIGPNPKPKKSGGVRDTYDTEPELKGLLQQVSSMFLRAIQYPSYLTGSLPHQDPVSNARIHMGAQRAITEDIKGFFDCITADHVLSVWRDVLHFGDEPSELLVRLTTRNGRVVQGVPTSSFLANLAFWHSEPGLVERLDERGVNYSRYVDDVTLSFRTEPGRDVEAWAIAQVYGMLGSGGFKPRRDKHTRLTASAPMTIMGLSISGPDGPTLPKELRSSIRAEVFQLEKLLTTLGGTAEFTNAWNRASGRVGRLSRLHPKEGATLRARLNVLKQGRLLLIPKSRPKRRNGPVALKKSEAPSDELMRAGSPHAPRSIG